MRTIFKMKGPGKALWSDNDPPRVIDIPASALVVVVDGNMYEDATVKIRFGGKILDIPSSDLRAGAELWG